MIRLLSPRGAAAAVCLIILVADASGDAVVASGRTVSSAAPRTPETIVPVFATPLDASHRPVPGMAPADFRVTLGTGARAVMTATPLASLPRTYLIVIDRDTLGSADGRSARTAALAILDRLPKEASVAFLSHPAINRKVEASADRQVVRKAIEATNGRFEDVKTFTGNLADRVSEAGNRDIVALEARLRAAELLTAVAATLDHLRGPQPIITVLLSNRIVTNSWNEPEIARIAAVSGAAGGPIFALPLYGESWTHAGSSAAGMRNLTWRTGGDLIPVVRDPSGAAQKVVDEAEGGYVLGVKAAPDDRDDQRADLTVATVRPGTSIVRASSRLVFPAPRGLTISPFMTTARAQWCSPMLRLRANAGSPPERSDAKGPDGLQQAGAFVDKLLREMAVLAADEVHEQHVRRELPDRDILFRDRTTQGMVVFAALQGLDESWVPYRDVLSVDGEAVRDWEHVLEGMFSKDRDAEIASKTASAVDANGRRFQIGSLSRPTSNPMMPLVFLQSAYRDRMKFQAHGTDTVNGVKTVRIDFSERAEPTLATANRGNFRDVRSEGSFWIEPSTGRVVKATMLWDEQMFLRSELTFTYAPLGESGLAPVEMRERYSTLSDVKAPGLLLETVSKYSNVRALARSAFPGAQ